MKINPTMIFLWPVLIWKYQKTMADHAFQFLSVLAFSTALLLWWLAAQSTRVVETSMGGTREPLINETVVIVLSIGAGCLYLIIGALATYLNHERDEDPASDSRPSSDGTS